MVITGALVHGFLGSLFEWKVRMPLQLRLQPAYIVPVGLERQSARPNLHIRHMDRPETSRFGAILLVPLLILRPAAYVLQHAIGPACDTMERRSVLLAHMQLPGLSWPSGQPDHAS